MGTEPEVMLTEWEEKYDLKTQHVNISNNEDAKQKLANHEIDCFVSMEESFWTELGISTITHVGSSDIYYAINKDRADIKEELDNAMRALEDADPFIRRISIKDISRWIIPRSLRERKRRGSKARRDPDGLSDG